MGWNRPRTIVSVAAVAVVAAVAGVAVVARCVAIVGPIVVPVTVTGAAGLVPTSYIAHCLIQCLALLVEPCSIHYAALARHRTDRHCIKGSMNDTYLHTIVHLSIHRFQVED